MLNEQADKENCRNETVEANETVKAQVFTLQSCECGIQRGTGWRERETAREGKCMAESA